MAGYSMTAVEDAILAALQVEMGSQLQTLETYQGDWRADLKRRTWRLPAALVTLVRQRGEQVAWGSYDLTLDVAVLVLMRQLRGEGEGRRGDGGVYELLESVRRALWHQDLGLELQPLALLKEEALLSTSELVVYGAYYRTGTWQDF
jgi:phage gp37-like protein